MDSRDAKVLAEATAVLEANRCRGAAQVPLCRFDYTCPSRDTYPFQFGWDSAFHAIALAHIDPVRAQAELSSLLLAKQPSGFLPHMVLWQDDLRSRAATDFTIVVAESGWHTVTTQPPVLPRAVERVWRATRDAHWLDSILADLEDVMRWWLDFRDPDGTGLVTIFQPDESGLDSCSKYDELLGVPGENTPEVAARWHEAMRGLFAAYAPDIGHRRPETDLSGHGRFVWKDVLVNCIFADSAAALARLLSDRGHPRNAADWERTAGHIGRALRERCWDSASGAFYDTYTTPDGQRLARVLTASSLFPLILEDTPRSIARDLVEHLTDKREFWLPYPVPSVAASEPSFDPAFETTALFRGPSWVNLNWYLLAGLRTHGFERVAEELAARTKAMVASSGLRECYNPLDGAGYGARDFAWSSLVVTM
ncbi:amylo-alpha-1,6-glucosidase [Gordonia sp. FQ]|uniref:amylo-alpha-1,6-glucosidase n=1 Tax=Gordonia sp. FQ TaxID=3446634 RepID=UPI003F86C045